MTSKFMPQHKRMAEGERVGFKHGGSISTPNVSTFNNSPLKTGKPDSPLEKAKRANGVPGMKKGGKAC